MLYVDHADDGANLYDLVCYLDLEDVVMEPKESKYGESWIKVKKTAYSQIQDRQERPSSALVQAEHSCLPNPAVQIRDGHAF